MFRAAIPIMLMAVLTGAGTECCDPEDCCTEDVDNDGYTCDVDCDDNNDQINPGAGELCDGLDNDCDGLVDEGGGPTWYQDLDRDGYGNDDESVQSCEQPDGYVAQAGDCEDRDSDVYPGANETCNDADDDCDYRIDEDAGLDWYLDRDVDGWGNGEVTQISCEQPPGYVPLPGDCNDLDPLAYPQADERCNGEDDDCDEAVDEDAGETWYRDQDQDGYGGTQTQQSCEQPNGYVAEDGDFNDTCATCYPGASEVCDGQDNDGDRQVDEDAGPVWYRDNDGDGYGGNQTQQSCEQPLGYVELSGDFNENCRTCYPGAPEVCDGRDNDGDDLIDEGATQIWYTDYDGDGYGGSPYPPSCEQPPGSVGQGGDFNDQCSACYPGASEICDGKDNDGDGPVDEDIGQNWYRDQDRDGWGDESRSQASCDQPSGYVPDPGDCNDYDGSVYPGAAEICDEVDQDCDEGVDEGVTVTFYPDEDGDGYSVVSSPSCVQFSPPIPGIEACPDERIPGYSQVCGDCDDRAFDVNPDAEEVCDNIDNDCDGEKPVCISCSDRPYGPDEDVFYYDWDTMYCYLYNIGYSGWSCAEAYIPPTEEHEGADSRGYCSPTSSSTWTPMIDTLDDDTCVASGDLEPWCWEWVSDPEGGYWTLEARLENNPLLPEAYGVLELFTTPDRNGGPQVGAEAEPYRITIQP